MELKVWVDGIQRVVCGLTENTTCQDVVVALALATKQTGRFTLIEKWRNNERFVSPNEKLLDALAKWGEYTNDVHFLLRKSPAKSSTYHHHHHHHSKSHHSTNHNHNHSHHRHTSRPLDRDKGPSKALDSLFKQINGRNSSLSSFSSESPTSSASLKGTPSPPALNLTDEKTSPSSSSSCPSTSVIKTCDQSNSSQENSLLNASPICQSSTPCEDGSSNGANNHSSLYASCQRSSPSKCNKDTQHSPPCDLQSPQLLGGTCSHPSHPINSLSHTKELESSSHSSPSTYSNGQSHLLQVDDESPPSKRSTKSDGKELIISPNDSPVRPPERPRDPLRIVSSYQSNALISQDLIDNNLQREIEDSVAGKSVDTSTSIHERLSPEEIDLKKKQASDIFAEIARVESNKAACDEKIQLLTRQIEEEQSLLEMKRIQEEEQRRVTELKKALEEKENILTQKQLEEGQIEDELRRVTDELKLKKDKVEQLEDELRKENLNALSIEPTECSISNLTTDASTSAFIKLHSDIKRPLSSVLLGTGFYNRIGSTRKIMGYPRSLQTTAPTKKNPQGVWV